MVSCSDMEKRRPSYDLAAVKAAFATPERLAITVSAFRDATSLGFGRAAIVDAVQALEHRHFHKSMTTLRDHTVWQDVYHLPRNGLLLHVKFQADVITEIRVMSFKEK